MKRILMILTSHQQMENTDSKTGVWLGEFTDPYYEFIDQGYQVTLASPLGGKPPVDGMSELTEHITGSNRRFTEDELAQQAFAHTHTLVGLSANNFDAVFFPGGHGPLWDLALDELSGKLILEFFNVNKPVAAVCHGPAALVKAAELVPGLLSGKRLTGFTNAEETLVGRANHIPFKLEDKLIALGADFKSALVPFFSHVETDGLLITGQNPLSAGPVAKALIEVLENGIAVRE
ncbi:type 1 glutamine amidotransferase domain-containing protein [Pedobacter sp.]|uniref:type 1 glutamine amidotransferase domain-containing protein n=1 Tax=Pedobacter sp. TaxID=1411316 RepID=UPI002CE0151A|nr:type 1 glutamine amidotransferase domain-containing protein [Pedobacter sp.]HWW43311.1 type 1 glutamine amidotransferase domain-containing protein [Pedobacter sp.]